MHASYLKKVNNSFLYRLFLISKLPIAWISGLKVNKVTAERAQISIRYKYLNQNPFKSMYFACQAMAAEMSTGLLALGFSFLNLLINFLNIGWIPRCEQ